MFASIATEIFELINEPYGVRKLSVAQFKRKAMKWNGMKMNGKEQQTKQNKTTNLMNMSNCIIESLEIVA